MGARREFSDPKRNGETRRHCDSGRVASHRLGPIEERLRSWTFDDAGGYAEGYFTREGNRWLQREIGVTPDGGRTGADNTITKISADRFTWESNNRTLDGDPQPSIG